MIRVILTVLDDRLRLPRRACQHFCRAVLAAEGVKRGRVNLVFLDDAAIHGYNRRFLQHDEPTDVITFALNEPAAPLHGEILISVETAQRVAGQMGHDPRAETWLYILHGLLHLCGYDDLAPAPRQRMRRRERWHLRQHGLAVAPVDPKTGKI